MKPFLYTSAFIVPVLTLSFCVTSTQAGDCSDAFAGTTWGEPFDLIDKTTNQSGTATVADGKLTLAAAGRDIYNSVNEYVALRRKGIEGDFELKVTVESQENIHDWSQAGFVVANDLDNLSLGGYVALDVTPKSGRVFFSDTKGTVGTLDSNTAKGVSGYPVTLRLAKQNKLFSAWYQEKNSTSWTSLVTNKTAQLTGDDSQIGIFSLSHDSVKVGKTVFSNFTCTDASVVTGVFRVRQRMLGVQLKTEGEGWIIGKGLLGRKASERGGL
jgi:hypothetical protein